jgi:dTDP-4-amino-4,6-dideoxygalactose transaminase
MSLSGVRAIVVVHYFGLPQPMTAIRRFCDERTITLIEDCAHALFGKADDQPVGSIGDYAIASLTKFLPTSDGGCLVGKRRSASSSVRRKPQRTSCAALQTLSRSALAIGVCPGSTGC